MENKKKPLHELPHITLDDIAQRKQDVLAAIRLKHTSIGDSAQRLVSPYTKSTAENKSLLQTFNQGFLIFDGVVVGMKLINRIRKMFRRR